MEDPEDPEDAEERCDNALFEVCDARERYPKRCAEELGKYLNSRNEIVMEPIVLKSLLQNFEISQTVDTGDGGTSETGNDTRRAWDDRADRLQSIINKVQELRVVLKQLEDNKTFEIKHHLK